MAVAERARGACLSAEHVLRAFMATMGEAAWPHSQRRRGERAMEMPGRTSPPVAEFAYRYGFAHRGHSTECFNRQFGATPVQVRR